MERALLSNFADISKILHTSMYRKGCKIFLMGLLTVMILPYQCTFYTKNENRPKNLTKNRPKNRPKNSAQKIDQKNWPKKSHQNHTNNIVVNFLSLEAPQNIQTTKQMLVTWKFLSGKATFIPGSTSIPDSRVQEKW